tara:strand:- start:349 stop:471 length:123 start_codon:yes stop_codon:yes gene_type:complete
MLCNECLENEAEFEADGGGEICLECLRDFGQDESQYKRLT